MPPMTSPERVPSSPDPHQKIGELYDYLKKKRQTEGMESITESDMEALDDILADAARNTEKYDVERLSQLFTLIEQLAAAESFRDQKTKDMVLRQIQLYRIELGVK